MKRVSVAVIISILLCIILVSCGGAAEEPTKAPTPEATASRNLYKDVKIGVLYCDDVTDKTGYSYAHDQGIEGMKKELGLKDSQVLKVFNIPSDDEKIIAATEELIEKGCKLIFSTHVNYKKAVLKCIDKYPDIIFSQYTTDPEGAINSNRYYLREYQAKYLAGVVAAYMSKTGHLGYISAFAGAVPDSCAAINAYCLGAQAVNPDVSVYVRISGAFDDKEAEQRHFKFLQDWSCDIFTQDTRTSNIAQIAQDKGFYAIGCRYDMKEEAPASVITSTITSWQSYYISAVKAFAVGDWTSFGNFYGGLKEGTVNLAPLADNCPEELTKMLDSVIGIMKTNQWDVFSGYKLEFDEKGNAKIFAEDIKDTKKHVAIKAGAEALDDSYIQTKMDYFVKGVSFPTNPSPSPTPEFTPTPEVTKEPTSAPTSAPTPAPDPTPEP